MPPPKLRPPSDAVRRAGFLACAEDDVDDLSLLVRRRAPEWDPLAAFLASAAEDDQEEEDVKVEEAEAEAEDVERTVWRVTQWDWCDWHSQNHNHSDTASANNGIRRHTYVNRESSLASGFDGGGGVCVRLLHPAPVAALIQQSPSEVLFNGLMKRFEGLGQAL